MMTANVILIAAAIGHFIHTVFLLNVSHGLGLNARWMDRVVLAILGILGLVTFAVGWMLWGHPWAGWPLAAKGYAFACLATLLVGLPAVTVRRAMRRMPPGVTPIRSDTIDLAAACGRDALVGPSGRSPLLRVPGNAALTLRSSAWSLTTRGLPESLNGLSILHMTDLHFAPTYSMRFFEEVIAQALAIGPEPDLVLITGDFLDHDVATAWVEPILSRIPARLGKFAILGNHDYRHDFRTLRRELRRAGFTTLEGKWSVLDVAGTRLAIGGTSHPWGKDIGRRPIPPADATILLSHAPDEIYRAAQWGVDLMLCGHNHGGQVRLPVIGPVLMPSRYSRRFDRGFFRVGPTLMYVSEGVGAKDPLRIGCHPEVARLVLRAEVTADDPMTDLDGRAVVELAGS